MLAVAHPWASASSYLSSQSPSSPPKLSSFSLLSLPPLSRRSPLPRPATPPPPADPLLSRLLPPFGATLLTVIWALGSAACQSAFFAPVFPGPKRKK